jgi:hypothetical protein
MASHELRVDACGVDNGQACDEHDEHETPYPGCFALLFPGAPIVRGCDGGRHGLGQARDGWIAAPASLR